MTTLSSVISTAVNSAVLTQFAAELGQLMNFGGRFSIQPGVLSAGVFQPAAPAFTASMGSGNTANVDLGDGYTLSIDERNSEIVVKDADGNTTRIWGDPHFDYNGKHVGDFWGTTTLVLENGTKITINTEQWNGNKDMYVASELVITRGDQALTIGGVSQNQLGDLSISMSGAGVLTDLAQDDGLVIHEGAGQGGGWTSSITGGQVGQADFDLTKPGMEGVREALEWGGALDQALGLWLFAGSLAGLTTLFAAASAAAEDARTAQPRGTPLLQLFSTLR